MEKAITLTEALTSCSIDEAARLSAAIDFKNALQAQADKRGSLAN